MPNLFDLGVSLGLTVRAKQDYSPSYSRTVIDTFDVSANVMVVMFYRDENGKTKTTTNQSQADFASLIAIAPEGHASAGQSISFYVGKTKGGTLFNCKAASYQIVKIEKHDGLYNNGKDHFYIAEPV